MFDRLSHMEPLFPQATKELLDLSLNVFRESAELEGGVHPVIRTRIARLLRNINSYYSNRIEGEHTTPADIERAVRKQYSENEDERRLQELSIAHIEVQRLIDERLEKEHTLNVASCDFLCWIHGEFYRRVPSSFLEIYDPDKKQVIEMIPGQIRTENVMVGKHYAPLYGSLEVFLDSFEDRYNPNKLSGHHLLMAAAASHHRLTWIHPFLDGNGRVSRLFTYAYLRKAKIESCGVWTLSRGLARRDRDYKDHLSNADSIRRGDLDGRGSLSEKALTDFCRFFFEVALDQIQFMKGLLKLQELRNRVMNYVDSRSRNLLPNEKPLREEAKYILAEIIMRGEIARGEVARLSGLGERTARTLTRQLLEEELIVSGSHKSPIRFNIPQKVVGHYFPELYPVGMI